MDNKEVVMKELALEERKFLHDISNHLVVAQGMANIVHRMLCDIDGIDPKLVLKQEKALKALGEQVKMIKERREVLHSRSN